MKKLFLVCITAFFALPLMAQLATSASILQEIYGDLDKDGKDEKIVVYNLNKKNEISDAPRRLIIYKGAGKNWTEWIKSDYAILGEDEGGVAGDPFENIEVKKGILWISHYGGSNWKWSKIDKYRYQNNDLQLIGYTAAHGMACNEWTNIDYNISTGDVEIKQEFDDCEGNKSISKEEKFNHKLEKKISIKTRNKTEYSFQSPKQKLDINL